MRIFHSRKKGSHGIMPGTAFAFHHSKVQGHLQSVGGPKDRPERGAWDGMRECRAAQAPDKARHRHGSRALATRNRGRSYQSSPGTGPAQEE